MPLVQNIACCIIVPRNGVWESISSHTLYCCGWVRSTGICFCWSRLRGSGLGGLLESKDELPAPDTLSLVEVAVTFVVPHIPVSVALMGHYIIMTIIMLTTYPEEPTSSRHTLAGKPRGFDGGT